MNATVVKQETASRLSRAELRSRWQRMLHDPMLADVPGKVELTEKGTIELSPASTRHGILQAFVAAELRRLLPHGTTITECGIETDIGVRVPDVLWASPAFMDRHGTVSPLPGAPELCVEVLKKTARWKCGTSGDASTRARSESSSERHRFNRLRQSGEVGDTPLMKDVSKGDPWRRD